MPSNRSINAFTQAFTNGFNTVDAAFHRRRREKLLEEELAATRKQREFNNKRLMQMDADRAEDREIAATERDYQTGLRQRMSEATALMSDPNVSDELLHPYRDIPQVAAFMAARTTEAQEDAEMQDAAAYIFNNQGGADPAVQATQQQRPSLQGDVIQAAQLPGSVDERIPVVSQHELNRMADRDPAAAQAYRDKMREQQEQTGEGMSVMEYIFESAPDRVRRLERRRRQAAEKSTVNDQWEQFYDINDQAGDDLRNVDSNILVDMYYEDRNTLDPELQASVDTRMQPHVQATIQQYSSALANLDPASPEAANVRSQLAKAYGVADAVQVSYQALASSGVDGRGLPNNNTNQQLTDNVIANGEAQPGSPYPANPNQTRADLTMVQRGNGGKRINERFAKASWRLLKGGVINSAQYESLMRTGRLPTAQPVIKDHDPKKDLIAQYPDGSFKVVVPARDPDKKHGEYLRNTIGDDALTQLNKLASALDSESDDARGTRALMSFGAVLAANENRARARGYDFSNVNDMMSLYQRFIDIGYFRDAYNDEWRYNGDWNPDFTQDFGSVGDALFNPNVDTAVQSGEFEGFERQGVTPLKAYNPIHINALIANGVAETPEEAAAILDREGL